jgi:osmotically-inducible protein OsmY
MKRAIFKVALALQLGFATAAVPADLKSSETMGEPVRDAHREMQILSAFSANPFLRAFDFLVSVDGGAVVLSGTVDDRGNKELAERIALHVGGITSVVNHIIVDANYAGFHHVTSLMIR